MLMKKYKVKEGYTFFKEDSKGNINLASGVGAGAEVELDPDSALYKDQSWKLIQLDPTSDSGDETLSDPKAPSSPEKSEGEEDQEEEETSESDDDAKKAKKFSLSKKKKEETSEDDVDSIISKAVEG